MSKTHLQSSGLIVFAACTIPAAAWAAQCPVNIHSVQVGDQRSFREVPEHLDSFGAKLARGDFDGDGVVDIVIAAPGEDLGAQSDAGVIHVSYSSAQTRTIAQSALPGESSMTNALFGSNLASGDFNADGYDDLIVTTAVAADSGQGRYYVLPGSPSGLFAAKAAALAGQQAPLWSPMSTGDFNGDGNDDVVIGQPFERTQCAAPQEPDGRIVIAFGAATQEMISHTITRAHPLGICGAQFGFAVAVMKVSGQPRLLVGAPLQGAEPLPERGSLVSFKFAADGTPITPGFVGGLAAYERLGYAIAVADLDGDGQQERILGAPGTPGIDMPGKVRVFAATAGTQTSGGNGYGSTLAVGDFNGDGLDDVAVGEPLAGDTDDGAIHVLFGRTSAVGTNPGTLPLTKVALGQPQTSGSQLGAALLAVDHDNDGRDELIIGAPLSTADTPPQPAVGHVYDVRVAATCPAP